MIVTDPKSLLDNVDQAVYNSMRAFPVERSQLPSPQFSEPVPLQQTSTTESFKFLESQGLPKLIAGRVQRFGDNVDTDQVCAVK